MVCQNVVDFFIMKIHFFKINSLKTIGITCRPLILHVCVDEMFYLKIFSADFLVSFLFFFYKHNIALFIVISVD